MRGHKQCNSYKGEITPAVPNIIEHDCHANKPNDKWPTDITEFSIPPRKVYLSPNNRLLCGMPASWRIEMSPDASLVNFMLDDSVNILSKNECSVVYSDCGSHYHQPSRISYMERYEVKRSMSKKGCSLDNSACEGFFDGLKNEIFYEGSWKDISIDDFIHELDSSFDDIGILI